MTKLIDGGLLFLKVTVLELELVVLLQTSCGTGKGALWMSANRAIPKNKHVPLLHKRQLIDPSFQLLDLFVIVVEAARPWTVSLPTLHFLQTAKLTL
jgi:hypothetical protein